MAKSQFSQKSAEIVTHVICDVYPGEDGVSILRDDYKRIFSGGLYAIHEAEKTVVRAMKEPDITDEGEL